MLEVYAFLAVFTAQIVVLTVLYPTKLIGRIRAQLARYPVERFPQLYAHGAAALERQLRFYRVLNALIAAAGLMLLVWFGTYMQRPDWNDGPVEALVGLFFALQLVPAFLFIWAAERANKRVRSLLRVEMRKAVLQRRDLFDFVSPFVVCVALLCYPLFVAFVIHIQRDPFPGFAGYANIGLVTALYVITAACVWAIIYGRKGNPLQTHADRMRSIEVTVKVCIYSCIAAVVFLSLNFTLVLLDLQQWEPLAQSAFSVIFALVYLQWLIAPPGELNVDRLRPNHAS